MRNQKKIQVKEIIEKKKNSTFIEFKIRVLWEETAKETGMKKQTKFEEKEEWDYKYEEFEERKTNVKVLMKVWQLF